MANAKLEKLQVARPVTYDTVDRVNLQLSLEEAKFVSAILSRVGGSPTRSMRALSDSIRDALDPIVGRRHFTGDCWFENNYDWDSRAHFSFGEHTNAHEHTKEY